MTGRARKQRMDLWGVNYNFASEVQVQVYDPMTDEEFGVVWVKVVDGRIEVSGEGVEVVVREGAVT